MKEEYRIRAVGMTLLAGLLLYVVIIVIFGTVRGWFVDLIAWFGVKESYGLHYHHSSFGFELMTVSIIGFFLSKRSVKRRDIFAILAIAGFLTMLNGIIRYDNGIAQILFWQP